MVLYYELYVGGTVAPKIMADLSFSFASYVMVAVIGNLVGAFGSLSAGLADRWGRVNIVVVGLFLTGVLVAVGFPSASSRTMFTVMYALLSVVEGVMLVATPALVRDFSPQLGRASAMGFWTMGPVLGSLVCTEVSSHTLPTHPDWRFQFYVCGVAGLVVAVIAFIGLRELSPKLRNQLMVSLKDRALIEAHAAGIDEKELLKGHWRSLLKLDVVGSAFAISAFLMFYYIAVGFFVVYFATTFGYSEARANALANWYWIANAIALVVAGVLSDRLRVRKPFMIIGGVISIAGLGLFGEMAKRPGTTYYEFAAIAAVGAVGGGLAYCAWMACFTETVEKHNPAATATGLAIYGWTVRCVVTVSLIGFMLVVTAATVLVDHGSRVQAIVTGYPEQVATISAVRPETLSALATNPTDRAAATAAVKQLIGAGLATNPESAVARLQQLSTSPIPADDLAYLAEHGHAVAQAHQKNPGQWQLWWWVCLGSQILFLPFVFVMSGRWSPRKAREDAERHEQLVQEELAKLPS
ncbi:MAG TPA: MFS transporter [Mycobacterium sp.]|nr:MFS transporter [Mycobacterium sp.]